jgi:hypothetical protein
MTTRMARNKLIKDHLPDTVTRYVISVVQPVPADLVVRVSAIHADAISGNKNGDGRSTQA